MLGACLPLLEGQLSWWPGCRVLCGLGGLGGGQAALISASMTSGVWEGVTAARLQAALPAAALRVAARCGAPWSQWGYGDRLPSPSQAQARTPDGACLQVMAMGQWRPPPSPGRRRHCLPETFWLQVMGVEGTPEAIVKIVAEGPDHLATETAWVLAYITGGAGSWTA